MKLHIIDAFTDRPFGGNPAAVCELTQRMPDEWMQKVAAEMNLSETAFLFREGPGWQLRWFTPTIEVALCGHATLASAHFLWENAALPVEATIKFATLSGPLEARRTGGRIELNFPTVPVAAAEAPEGLLEALGLTKVPFIGRSKFDYLLELESAAAVRSLKPNFHQLAQIESRGLIVTAKSDVAEHDFISRFFAPRAGVNEDPVTGSSHCALAPYWTAKLGERALKAFQASKRSGRLEVEVKGDRVLLRGGTVTVMKGELA